uniref:DNA2/NAM7 helicase helicase domain-containing protein n=1 Tax=Auxenochlorella protothecoides TaxID=3075 RepID=A0A1D2ACK6_AUXPR
MRRTHLYRLLLLLWALVGAKFVSAQTFGLVPAPAGSSPPNPVESQEDALVAQQCIVKQNAYFVLNTQGTTYILSNITAANATVNNCCSACHDNTSCDAWQWCTLHSSCGAGNTTFAAGTCLLLSVPGFSAYEPDDIHMETTDSDSGLIAGAPFIITSREVPGYTLAIGFDFGSSHDFDCANTIVPGACALRGGLEDVAAACGFTSACTGFAYYPRGMDYTSWAMGILKAVPQRADLQEEALVLNPYSAAYMAGANLPILPPIASLPPRPPPAPGASPGPPPPPPPPAPCFLLVETVQQEASRSGKPRLTVIKGRLSETAGAPLGSTAILVRVTSLTPHYRQLAALARCPRLPPPLQRLLLDPGAATAGQGAPHHDDPLPAPLRNALAARHNASQLAAIRGALVDFRPPSSGRGDQPGAGGWGSGPSLTLVQGPPGTGKTTAILGMVAAFLGCAAGARGRAGGTFAPPCSDSRPASGEAVRVLLCAQSNAAVDELVGRLCQRGILDSYGKARAVRVLRLGTLESAAPRASATHIDAIVAEMERAEAGGAGHGFAWGSHAREVQDVAKELKNVLQDIECQENQARLIRPMISELRNELENESSSRRRRHGDSESVR